MIRDVELINYLPPFIQEYMEMDAIMTAENPEFQLLCDTSEQLKDNQFITTCDETGISFFENLLGITPSDDDTLESRISRVLVRWNEGVPYTYKVLIQRLVTLCGEGQFTLEPDWNNYKLKIITHLKLYGQTDTLDKILNDIIPCNILVDAQNLLEHEPLGVGYSGSPIATTKHIPIDTKINTEYSVTGVIGNPYIVATTKHITI